MLHLLAKKDRIIKDTSGYAITPFSECGCTDLCASSCQQTCGSGCGEKCAGTCSATCTGGCRGQCGGDVGTRAMIIGNNHLYK